jgi:hypothetical protein
MNREKEEKSSKFQSPIKGILRELGDQYELEGVQVKLTSGKSEETEGKLSFSPSVTKIIMKENTSEVILTFRKKE